MRPWLAAACWPLLPIALSAQVSGGRTQARCAGQRITEISIRSEAPDFGNIQSRSTRAANALQRMHRTTAPRVIRRLLLLKVGDRCRALARAESERLLRAMPFLADAQVTAYPDGPEAVKIEVITVDEPSLLLDARLRNEAPFLSRFALGNGNLAGNGVLAAALWRDGRFYRDEWSARYNNYQLFTKPYQLVLRASRRRVGYDWEGEVSAPFLSDVQRIAWRAGITRSEDYTPFFRGERIPASLPYRRESVDAGLVSRIGAPGQLGLIGAQFSVEDVEPARGAVAITDSGLVADTTRALRDHYPTWRSVRLNALLGFRRIRFVRVAGFDALNGPQDLRTGLQIGTTIGRALPLSRGVARHETYVGGSLYAGAAGQRMYAAIQGDLDARHDSSGRWRDVLTHGRAAWYVKPHPRHLLVADLSWAAGRDVRIPYQLALGDRFGGLRGYADERIGGARRTVARFEERWRVANIRGAASVGVGAFVDVGSIAAGDVPLGRSSGMRQSVGTSLLIATPVRSQRLWRVDIAYPLQRSGGAGLHVRVSSNDRTRIFWDAPFDIQRARERSLPQSIFNWP